MSSVWKVFQDKNEEYQNTSKKVMTFFWYPVEDVLWNISLCPAFSINIDLPIEFNNIFQLSEQSYAEKTARLEDKEQETHQCFCIRNPMGELQI